LLLIFVAEVGHFLLIPLPSPVKMNVTKFFREIGEVKRWNVF